jgi:hypothetical protein
VRAHFYFSTGDAMSANRIPTASQIETQQVILQPDNYQDCGLFAIVNLYRRMGLEPPTFAQIGEVITGLRAESQSMSPVGKLTMMEAFAVLTKLKYPGTTAYGVTSLSLSASDCLPAVIDQGCGVLIGFVLVKEGRLFTHVGVIDSYNREWLEILCGVIGRALIPWTTLPLDWDGLFVPATMHLGRMVECGLLRDFVIAYPSKQAANKLIYEV